MMTTKMEDYIPVPPSKARRRLAYKQPDPYKAVDEDMPEEDLDTQYMTKREITKMHKLNAKLVLDKAKSQNAKGPRPVQASLSKKKSKP